MELVAVDAVQGAEGVAGDQAPAHGAEDEEVGGGQLRPGLAGPGVVLVGVKRQRAWRADRQRQRVVELLGWDEGDTAAAFAWEAVHDVVGVEPR